MKRNRDGQKGTVLITTLLVLSILIVLSVSARLNASSMILYVKKLKERYSFREKILQNIIGALHRVKDSELETPDNPGIELINEGGRINLNAITLNNSDILINLMTLLGFTEDQARTVTFSIIDWKDIDNSLIDEKFGAENDYYEGLEKPYRCKNYYFETLPELRLVRGVNEEIYLKLAEYMTVYPKQGLFVVDISAINELTLKALARKAAKESMAVDISQADSLAEKVIFYMQDKKPHELPVAFNGLDLGEIPFNSDERILFSKINRYMKKTVNLIRFRPSGFSGKNGIHENIDCLIKADDLSILEWNALDRGI